MARDKIWVVREGDGATAGAIVARAGETVAAIAEGRVFVGRRRIDRADHPVRTGETVRIGAPGPRAELAVLFRGGGLIACAKPAGLPTVPDHAGAAHSLVALVARECNMTPSDVRITSRLDRDVSGVVVFALDDAAESRLKAARARGGYHRRYVALARGAGSLAGSGVWDAPIGRHPKSPLLRAARGADAKESTTYFRAVAAAEGHALLAVDPITGRTHQIRVHAASAGAPLVGDRDYGGPAKVVLDDGRVVPTTRIALHAARVTVPTGDREVTVEAPVPEELRKVWEALGGSAEAWDTAVRCDTRS